MSGFYFCFIINTDARKSGFVDNLLTLKDFYCLRIRDFSEDFCRKFVAGSYLNFEGEGWKADVRVKFYINVKTAKCIINTVIYHLFISSRIDALSFICSL